MLGKYFGIFSHAHILLSVTSYLLLACKPDHRLCDLSKKHAFCNLVGIIVSCDLHDIQLSCYLVGKTSFCNLFNTIFAWRHTRGALRFHLRGKPWPP